MSDNSLSNGSSKISKENHNAETVDYIYSCFSEINQCMLHLGGNCDDNIQMLTELCGRLLGATCAIYNRLEDNTLLSCGQWHVPPDYNPWDKPDGHICYDVILNDINGPFVVCNLPKTHYAVTDPNVAKYNLKTYIGHPIRCGTSFVGSICAVFQHYFEPKDDDKKIIGIIASAISLEEERRKAEHKNREQEQYLRAILQTTADGFWVVETDGSIIEVNEAYCRMSGYSREELLKSHISDLDALEKQSEALERIERIIRNGSEIFETRHLRKDGSIFDVEVSVTFLNVNTGKLVCFGRDITERKEQEKESAILLDLLRILDQPNGFDELLRDIIQKLHEISNCEAVGIRLKEGDDYPYYQTFGFPESFIQLEKSLCTHDLSGQVIKDELGNPVLDCMCGNIICRRFDPMLPFFTPHGSFWTNSTSEFLSTTTESDRQARTRNRCNGEGYESVALIPLYVHGEALGLIQLNDPRKGMFTRKIIAFFERLADNIAQTLIQKKIQIKVEQNQKNMESIFRASPTGIGVVENRVFKYVNHRLSEMTGYSSSELVSSNARILYPTQEDYDYVGVEKYRQLAEKEVGEIETRWKCKDGRIIDVLLRSTPIDVHDFSKGTTFTALDITVRKQMENALTLSEEKYRNLVQKSHSIILKWDRRGKVLFLNEFGQRFFGYSEEEIIGKNVMGTIVPEQEVTGRSLSSLMSDIFENPGKYEYNINENMCKDGRRVWISWSNNPLYDSKGQITEMFSVGVDVTSEKQAKEQLKLQSLVLDQITDCVTVADLNGIITYVNKAEVQALGYSHEELIGKPTKIFGDNPERGATQQEILKETLRNEHWHGDVMNKTSDGREVLIDCRTQVVRNEVGQAIALCGISTDITERKLQEDKLLNSERQLSNALKIAKMGHWELDVSSGVFTFSDSFYDILHTTVKEMGGYEISIDEYTTRFVHPEDSHLVHEEILKALESENPNYGRYLEHRIVYADGCVGQTAVRFFVVKDSSGKTIKTYGVNQDITERKQIEKALIDSNQRYRELVERINDGLVSFDAKMNYIFVNDAGGKLLGRDPKNLIGKNYWEEYPEAKGTLFANAYIKAFETQETIFIEEHFKPWDRWFSNTIYPSPDDISIIFQDITERKRAEEALEESNKRMEAFLQLSQKITSSVEQNELMQAIVDDATKIIGIENGAVYLLTDDDQIYVAATTPAFPPNFPEELCLASLDKHPHIRKAITSGKYVIMPDSSTEKLTPLEQEIVKIINIHSALYLPIRLKGHSIGVLILSSNERKYNFSDEEIFLLQGFANQAAQVFENVRNYKQSKEYAKELEEEIAERKRAENLLITARKDAESANMAKSEFLAIMSHELRTPLNAIIGFNEILQDTELNHDQKHYVEIVQKSGKALLDIIEDILDFSKIEASKLKLETLDFDLLELLEGFADTMTLRATQKGLRLVFNIDPNVPSLLCGDAERLLQILTNLAVNAIKFTSQGEVVIHVSEESQEDENVLLRFSVKDTGIGIPEDKMEYIFEKFAQIDASNTRRFGGTGLGLAISKRLVEMMGGNIGVFSDVGAGSEFWFTVRLRKHCRTKTVSKVDTVYSLQSHDSDLHILLVEDDIFNQKVAREMLMKLGFNADVVVNGKEAIKTLEMIPYDLVLMDVQMPEMDGIEATRIIRDTSSAVLNHEIPIIAMTAHAIDGDREYFIGAGMDDYVAKPVTLKALRELINKWNQIIQMYQKCD